MEPQPSRSERQSISIKALYRTKQTTLDYKENAKTKGQRSVNSLLGQTISHPIAEQASTEYDQTPLESNKTDP